MNENRKLLNLLIEEFLRENYSATLAKMSDEELASQEERIATILAKNEIRRKAKNPVAFKEKDIMLSGAFTKLGNEEAKRKKSEK